MTQMATTPETAGAVAQPQPTPEPTPAPDSALESQSAGGFSLADLAGLDVSGIAEIRSERLPAMAALFKGKKVSLGEQDNKDGERRFVATVSLEVAEVQALVETGLMPPGEIVGKTHTERFWIVPEKAQEGIGRIRAFVTDIGLNSAGPLGGMTDDGAPPGILDSIVGHVFPAKIVTQKNSGETYSRLKLPKKTAG